MHHNFDFRCNGRDGAKELPYLLLVIFSGFQRRDEEFVKIG
jgi:hypothetical protein